MKKLYIFLILLALNISSYGQASFDSNDVAALKAIRDNAQSDSPLKANWADDNQVGTWQGVDWDYSSPKQVISLNVGGGNNLWSLDVTGLKNLQYLYCNNTPLTSLNVSGLKNIISIECHNDHLTSLDLTGLTSLEILTLQYNQLTSLILTGLTNLTHLNCDNNQLTTLSLAGLSSLQYYSGSFNPLTSLDASGLVNLLTLWCDNNLLTSINLSGLPKLEGLMCFVNPLISIDVSGLTNLQSLICSSDKLTSIDVSGLAKLSVFAIDGNMIPFSKMPLPGSTYFNYTYFPQNRIFEEKEITLGQEIDYSSEATIDGTATAFSWYKNGVLIDGTDQSGKYTPVEGGFYRCEMTNASFPNLREITSNVKIQPISNDYDLNDLAILKSIRDNAPGSSSLKEEWADESLAGTWIGVLWDDSTPKKVKGLYIDGKSLTSLDVRGLARLNFLQCDQNKLFSLNVSGLTFLQTLTSGGNQLTSLDLSGLTNLTTFDCSSNQLSSLEVSGLSSLKTFSCSTNRITSLNVSGLSMLESLDCTYNPLGTLDVSGLANLQALDCESDQLTSLNVSGATNLESLMCLSNYLTSLDVTSLANLHNLSCDYNEINTLNLSGLTNLDYAVCDHNKLTSLNVSDAKNLTAISCNDNNLTVLDVTGLTKITSLTVYDNNIPFSHLPLVNLPNSSYYVFAPQNKIFEAKTIDTGIVIDYSSEATIDGTPTAFSWYMDGVLISGTDQSGKYTPTTIGAYNCEMTNTKFPELTLTTNTVTVVSSTVEFDPNDVAVLKAIRDNAPADSPLKTDWADESQIGTWAGITWDSSTPERVTDMDVSSKKLTTLDLSGLSKLEKLFCNDNQLTSLNVTGLNRLLVLLCNDNQLASLNLDGLISIQSLGCGNNKLSSMDFSALNSLVVLECSGNQIVELDVSKLKNLIQLGCAVNKLTSLDVSNLTGLQFLYCYNNQLTSLDISTLINLKYLTNYGNNIQFSQLPLPNSSYNTYKFAPQNKIFEAKAISIGQEIDYSSEATIDGTATAFSWYRDDVLIASTDQTGKYTPTEAGEYFCAMTNAKFPDLTLTTNTVTVVATTPEFDANDVAILKTIRDNAPSNSPLKTEWADESQIGDWTGVTWDNSSPQRVQKLELTVKNLTALDVSGLSNLQVLTCSTNQLSSLNISGLINLQTLQCDYNQLSSVNLSGLTNLYTLYCGNNLLPSLDLSSLTNLHSLACEHNQLTELNVSGLINLQSVVCSYNPINSLDLTGISKLTWLECDYNELTSLDVSGQTNLVSLSAVENNIPFSRLPLPNVAFSIKYSYAPQYPVFEDKEIHLGQEIDYSSEATIDGTATVFSWFRDDVLIASTDQSGKYTPTEAGAYYCEMTNAKFPGLTLTTNTVTVVSSTVEFDPNDVAVLKTIRDNAPADSPLKTEWADESQIGTWSGVTWDSSAPKRVLELSVYSTKLETLNLSGLSGLQHLDCQKNSLTSLNLSGLVSLQYVYCDANQLSSLNVSGLTNLKSLQCDINQLTSLDMTGLTNLQDLQCTRNQLSSLEVSNLTNLQDLKCGNNQIISLNISKLINLAILECSNNRLSLLDISSTKINSLNIIGNFIPFSQMPLPNSSKLSNFSYYYIPQNKIFEAKDIQIGQEIDYSSEAMVDGTATVFSWYKSGILIAGTDQGGKYTPTTIGAYYCEMTNSKFPGLTLTTNTVTVNKVNNAPIANAGIAQSVNEGEMVTLDGSASSDPDNDPLTFKWTAPDGITLSSNSAVSPTFTAPQVMLNTNYTFSLVVNDGNLDSPAEQVVITVKHVNNAPVANAGIAQSVNEGEMVTLDGSASSDPDNDPLIYKWTAPDGITLSSNSAVRPTFTTPQVSQDTDLVFSLIVNDGSLNSSSSQVIVGVKDIPPVLKLVSKLNSSVIPSGNIMYLLYKKDQNSFLFENLIPISMGDTTQFNVTPGEWIALVYPVQNSFSFIPTYVGNVLDWNVAERINIPDKGNVVKEISCIQPEAISVGIGQISGSINESNTVSTKSISIISSTADNGNPISGALVQLYKKGGTVPVASTLTDSLGLYKFDQLEITDYEIMVEIPGYIQSEKFGVTVSQTEPSISVKFGVNTSSQTITDINKTLFSSLKIFPNPTDGKFTIINNGAITSFEIYNLSGIKVYSTTGYSQQIFTEVDLSKYAKGVYLIELYSGNQSEARKLIVQ